MNIKKTRGVISAMAMLIAVVLVSCRGSLPDEQGNDFTYTVDLDNAVPLDRLAISAFCDSVVTIITETNDRVSLSRIRKLACSDDRVFILDDNPRETFLAEFDTSGNFVRRYGHVGRGPGEYVRLFDFALDTECVYLLDVFTRRILSYDLKSGEYLKDFHLGSTWSVYRIAKAENTFYSDLHHREFDESNHVLQSWKRDDLENKTLHLPIGEYLPGWINTSRVNGVHFIRGGDGCYLFSHELSNKIFKLYPDSIGKYLYMKSDYYIGEKERKTMSEALISQGRNTSASPPPALENSHPTDFNMYWGVRDYFETDQYICFNVIRNGQLPVILYDKHTGTTQRTAPIHLDLIVKEGYLDVSTCLRLLYTDERGLYYGVSPDLMEYFVAAVAAGKLHEDLDKLELLKTLTIESNPVIFFMKYK